MQNRQQLSKLFVLIVLIAVLALVGCAGNSNSSTDTTSGGSVGQVSSLTVTDKVQTSGTLSADQLSKLAWATTGLVDKVNVKAGDRVQAGDVLASLKIDSVPANIISAQADESGIGLVSGSVTPGAVAIVDPQRTEQVIGNLVNNALRFTPRGGRIWIDVQRAEGAVSVTVNDNGPGVPEDQLALIFERFWRSDKSRARTSGGAGLGLAIARQLVEGQGGSISALNRSGGGLSISISFPPAGS